MNDDRAPIRAEGDDVVFVSLQGRQIGRVRTVRCGTFEALAETGASIGIFNSAYAGANALITAAGR